MSNSLQTIINELDEAIIAINAEHKITELNSAAEALLGVSQKACWIKMSILCLRVCRR